MIFCVCEGRPNNGTERVRLFHSFPSTWLNCAGKKKTPIHSTQTNSLSIITNIIILTGVSEVLILVIGGKKSIVLGGLRLLLGEVLVLDFGKLDHYDGVELKVLIKGGVVSEGKKKRGGL